MANYTNLKQSVKNAIKNNGRQDITGDGMQAVLLSIIGSVGQYATFAGIADPSTNPGTQDGNVFYIATKSGVYPNFGGLEVKYGGLSIFENSTGSWLKKDISIETLPNVFDGNKVNNIVKEGGFSDVFVINGQTVDPKTGDLLYNADGIYGKWGVITDIHLEGKQLYIKYIWDGYVNTIMIDENGDAARYVNRYKTPKVYDAKSVLSASSAGNMQDYFLIKDPDNSTEYFFEFWQVGDLIGSPKGGIIVSDVVNPGGLDNTMMYIYGGEIVTITYKAQSPAKIMSVSKAKIGSPEDAANATGSLYARVAFNKKEIGTSTDEAKADGSLYARIKYLMDKKNYKRYNRNLLDKLTTQSTPAEIEAAFTPIGESSFRRPKEGDVFISGNGQWLGSGADYVVTFCSDYWQDWTLMCVGTQKEVVINYTEDDGTRQIKACKTREIGWPSDFGKGGSSYATAVNELLLRRIYEYFGAVYNESDNTFTFNELKLSQKEMLDAYLFENCTNVRGRWQGFCYYTKYKSGKTNFCADKIYYATDTGPISMDFQQLCYSHSGILVFKIPYPFVPLSLDSVIQNCDNLVKVLGELDMRNIKQDSWNSLKNNKNLEVIKIKKLKCSINMKKNPKINYDSWKFLVDNAENESAITVTIDPVPFALLTGTAPNEDYTPTGHSKEEWTAINTDAQEKQISFAEQV